MIEQIEAKAMAGEIPVYCAHDKILETDRLVENPKNPNKHPKAQIESLAKIIKYQGWRHPIVISTRSGFVVKGHGRLMAARELKTAYVPVDYQNYESEASEYADLIADNKIQEFSELDMQMSADILKDIKDSGDIELEMSGFTEDALNELFSKLNEGEIKEDEFNVEEALKEPVISKQGDLWLLGRHRLICGDSTKTETYEILMDGKKANLVVTDPPYGVSYDGSQGKIKNDDLQGEDFYKFLFDMFKNVEKSMSDDASIYVFHADTKGIFFRRAFEDAGFYLSGVCQWVKQSLVLGRSPYQWRNEPCLFGWKKNGKHKWYAGRSETTVWEFDKPSKNKLHSTMKPIPLIAYPIKNSSTVNSIVLEPFAGSFSTGIACEQTDRICYAVELDEKYVDVCVSRYYQFKGSSDDVFLIRDGTKIKYCDIERKGVE